MRILVLVILAVIAYLLYKKFIDKSSASTPALDDASTNIKKEAREIGSGATEAAENRVTEGFEAAKDSSPAEAAQQDAANGAANLMPDTGSAVGNIQELFKILNLRASDASRLDLSQEQFENLKSGQPADLSGETLDAVLARLKAML